MKLKQRNIPISWLKETLYLATVVWSSELSLLYLIENPEDPVTVQNNLSDQFEKKTWANNWNYVENCIRYN